MSLRSNEGVDLQTSLIVWLAYAREAMLHGLDQNVVTFDQLLANPVSAIQKFIDPLVAPQIKPQTAALLDFVQPSLKHHHTFNLTAHDKQVSAPYAKMYDDLRNNQHAASDDSFSLIGNLLHSLSHHLLSDTVANQLQISINNTHYPVPENQWHKITHRISDSAQLKTSGLCIGLNTVGTLYISSIKLRNKATEEVIWSAARRRDFDRIEIQGQALRLPDPNNLLVLITEKRDCIHLKMQGQVENFPLELELNLKLEKGMEVLDSKKFMVLGRDDHSIKKICSDERLVHNNKLIRMLLPIWPETTGNSTPTTCNYLANNYSTMIKTKKFSANASYCLPTYLISFPRSGSNFLQTVLEKSSGLKCCSFYSPRPKDSEHILSFKSHALSPEYLQDEISRYIPGSHKPEKIIFLRRDPRDVMISFYEFVLDLKKINIRQDLFLHNICYHYAFDSNPPMVQSSRRKVETSPMNIQAAFQRHIQAWVTDRPAKLDILDVSYENLVNNPENEFKRIFDFLEMDASLNKEALKIKVSQYSDENRPRGVAYGWKNNSHHTKLIYNSNRHLKKEIDLLGYRV
jgi:hypothetical protein